MRTAEPPEVTVLQGYSRDEVLLILGRIRQKTVSLPTFYRWLDLNSIAPKFEYQPIELEILKYTARYFKRGGKAANYQRPSIQEN